MTHTAEHSPFLAICIENAELRQQLAEVQDQCIELAVDAGEIHAENAALRARFAEVCAERDAWRAQAECIGKRTVTSR